MSRKAFFLPAFVVAVSLLLPVASANAGFFDELFGQPAYQPQPQYRSYAIEPDRTERHRQRLARLKAAKVAKAKREARRAAAHRAMEAQKARDTAPTVMAYAPDARKEIKVCCTTAQEAIERVAHDETLRPGDAYMTPDGLRIFVGSKGARAPASNAFVPVAKARGLGARAADALRQSLEPQKPARAGRKASARPDAASATPSVAAPLTAADTFITDPRGRRIRLIGGASFGYYEATTEVASRPPSEAAQASSNAPDAKDIEAKAPDVQADTVRTIAK